MHERLRRFILRRWGRAVTTHPRVALLIVIAIAACAGGLAAWKLDFRTDRSELVSMDRVWNRRYAIYKDNFPRWDDITIAIEGEPGDGRINELARSIADRLRGDARIAAADAGFDAREAPRMYQIAPLPEFQQALAEIERARSVATASNVNSALATLMLASRDGNSDESSLRAILEPFVATVRGEEAEFPLAEPTSERWQPFVTASGRIRTISVQIDNQVLASGGLVATLQWMREEVSGVVAASDIAEVEWGITGIGAIEADETAQSRRDATWASILAFVLLGVLLVTTFRGVVVPLLALASLILALCLAFGWAAFAVGHLQILSIFFAVMFLGIGMDFAVHLASRLELVRDEEDELPHATERVFEAVGPGILTGALTTGASFATIALTDFRGAAELGLICAGGIILCALCVPTAFPAMLALTGRWRKYIHSRPHEAAARFRGLIGFFTRRPWGTILAAMALSGTMAWLGSTVRYDPNLLNLQPEGTESVAWEKRLVEEDQTTAWAALLPVRPEDVAETVRRLREVEEVGAVSAMGMTVLDEPESWDARTQAVSRVRENQQESDSIAEGPPALRDVLVMIAGGIRTTAPDLAAIADWIDESIAHSHTVSFEDRDRTWTHLHETFLARRAELANVGEDALRTDPISADNVHEFIPAALRSRWIGSDGTWLLRIQPRAEDESVLDPDRLGVFVDAVRVAEPNIIGPPVQIYESGRLIQQSYIFAAMMAVPLVLLVLLLDFQSIVDALCALLPMLFGFISMFGMMAIFGVPLNFANMIVLPITFGIAIDAGVHMVHRWRSDPSGEPPGLSGGTGRGITVTVLTTLIGFACLLIAEHRGIRSLGFVVVAGQSAMLIACYTILPAVLALRTKRMNPQMITNAHG